MGRGPVLPSAAAGVLLALGLLWPSPSLGRPVPATWSQEAAAEAMLRAWGAPATTAAAAPPPPAGGAPSQQQERDSAPYLLEQLPLNATALRQQLDGTNGRVPVMFIPPLGGVQLEMRLDWPSVPHWWCPRASFGGWRLAWLNLLALLPGRFDCWADNFGMECHGGAHCRSPSGIEVRPKPGFESGMGVAPGIPGGFGKTFGPLADALEQLGWSRGGDMRAHLYDWRLPPADWVRPGGSFDQLQREIEAAAEEIGRPVVAISLSLGSLYFGLFARRHVSAAWAERHLAGHVSLSGTWAGSLWAPLAIVAGGQDPESQGLNPLVPALQQDSLRSLLRSMPVLPYLSPAPAVFGSQRLVQDAASGKQYGAPQIGGWLRDSGAQQAAEVWQQNERWMERGGAPPAETWCLFGTGVSTVTGIRVLPPGQAGQRFRLDYGDGDGTVPLPSLQVCDGWQAGGAGMAPPPSTGNSSSTYSNSRQAATRVRRYPGLRHGDIIHSAAAFADVLDALLKLGAA